MRILSEFGYSGIFYKYCSSRGILINPITLSCLYPAIQKSYLISEAIIIETI